MSEQFDKNTFLEFRNKLNKIDENNMIMSIFWGQNRSDYTKFNKHLSLCSKLCQQMIEDFEKTIAQKD